MVMVSGRLVTTGDTGTCAVPNIAVAMVTAKKTGGSSYNWTEQMVGCGREGHGGPGWKMN